MALVVLLVEDEPLVREAIARALGAEGWEIAQAGSATEADRLVEAGVRPDLAVIDDGLPDEPGHSLTVRLLARWPSMPALLVSGAIQAGSDPRIKLLAKPFRPAELRAVARKLVGR